MTEPSQQTLRYVDETPAFKEAVLAAAKRGRRVTITLVDFDDDPLRLYACLDFARHSGVTVAFAPSRTG